MSTPLEALRELRERHRDGDHERLREVARKFLLDSAVSMRPLAVPHQPLTNNAAESALRHDVTARRISRGTRTSATSRGYALLASVIETCRLRAASAIELLAQAIDTARKGLPALKRRPSLSESRSGSERLQTKHAHSRRLLPGSAQNKVALIVLAVGGAAHANMAFVDDLSDNAEFSPEEVGVIRRAEALWGEAIQNNNAAGGANRFVLSFAKANLRQGVIAQASGFTANDDGVPFSARIDVNAALPAATFVDLTPGDHSEFNAVAGFPFYFTAKVDARDPSSGLLVSTELDYLTTLLHEIGHSVGIAAQYTRFSQHLSAANPAGFRNFDFANGDFASITMQNNGTHTEVDQLAIFNGMQYSQQHDLMNPVQIRGERILISNLDLAMLAEAFGYQVAPVPEPSSFWLGMAGLTAVMARRLVTRRGQGQARTA